MQWSTTTTRTLIFLLLITAPASAQLPFYYFIDFKGKVQFVQVSGQPYQMAFYRENQPLATLVPTENDSSQKLIRYHYSYDRNRQELSDKPYPVDSTLRHSYDFSSNYSIRKNYLYEAYPFWQDYGYPLFRAQIQKGQYHYKFDYIHYTPPMKDIYPHTDPSTTGEAYTPVSAKWQLDSTYKIVVAEKQGKDTTTSWRPPFITTYSYFYNEKGSISKVINKTVFQNSGNQQEKAVYFFYTAFNKPKYVIAISKNKQEPSEEYCKALLDTLMSTDRLYKYEMDQDSPAVAWFTAYCYDTRQRFTSCVNFDASERIGLLVIDSVTYNRNGLPDTIDQYYFRDRDERGSRTVIIYDKWQRVVETIENKSKQWFRNFKSQVAYPMYTKFAYDSRGRIITKDVFFGTQIDSRTKYDYVSR